MIHEGKINDLVLMDSNEFEDLTLHPNEKLNSYVLMLDNVKLEIKHDYERPNSSSDKRSIALQCGCILED